MAVHEPPTPSPSTFRVIGGRPTPSPEDPPPTDDRGAFPWKTYLIGAVAAQLFALPILSYMGWFLASLVHEMGHAATAWLCGMPSFPAIRLDGHAAAVHSEQSTWLVFAVAGGLGWLAWTRWQGREHPFQAIGLAILAVFVPLLAFSDGPRELAFLVMGHGGELIFAGLALVRAAEVDEREPVERALYATLAWYLLWKNFTLFFGLLTSAKVMIEYYGSGSFGLTNDLIRAAEDVIDCSVQAVAGWMLVATIVVVPIAFVCRRMSARPA